jgi:hypothetical protein
MKNYTPFSKTHMSPRKFRAYMEREKKFYYNLSEHGTNCKRGIRNNLERLTL